MARDWGLEVTGDSWLVSKYHLRASPQFILRDASDFYAPHRHFAFLIQANLSNVIKGRYAPRANLEITEIVINFP